MLASRRWGHGATLAWAHDRVGTSWWLLGVAMTAPVDAPRVSRARANALGLGSDPGRQRPRRNRRRIVAGVVLMVVCGWLAAVVFLSAGSRREVVALTNRVERFAELSEDDLTVVRVAADSDVVTVPASQLDDFVGRVAGIEMLPGALLQADAVLDEDAPTVSDGDAVVGVLLTAPDAPDRLPRGAAVRVILRPAGGSEEELQTLEGRVMDVTSDVPGSEPGRWVSLIVADEQAGTVSAAAADRRVSVVVTGG
jgi:hypothetical protein